MTYRWTTHSDGSVEVEGHGVPTLSPTDANVFDERVWRWREFAQKWGAQFRVPVAWILGMIFAESLGNPRAKSRDGGFGLMQLTSNAAREGKSYEELTDPEENVRLGTKFIRFYCLGPNASDLPRVASKYNAGGNPKTGAPHPGGEPWGLRETKGHISRVVAASNYAVTKLRAFAGDGLDSLSLMFLSVTLIRWLS